MGARVSDGDVRRIADSAGTPGAVFPSAGLVSMCRELLQHRAGEPAVTLQAVADAMGRPNSDTLVQDVQALVAVVARCRCL